ncbi:FtsL-like putative cell division protein [Porphyromonas loveana]|uniref:FtsL-like putative cell division protein n=1 Tax=Porphyromonas loveana TaxID=1884669 RepID=UPI0035A13560
MTDTTKHYIDDEEDILYDETPPQEGEIQADESAPQPTAQPTNQKRKNTFWGVMGGSFLEHPWVASNLRLGLVLVFMSIVNIWNGYEAIDQVRQIGRLEEQVRDYRYRALFKASEVTAMSQKLNVEKAIQEQNLALTLSQAPPYILYRPTGSTDKKK